MRARTFVILEQAIEEGVARGYRRAFKHNDSPEEHEIMDSIVDCTMGAISEYFIFDETEL